jgi:hypothetical protein
MLLLGAMTDETLARTGRVISEAAYYLSDTIDPDERAVLLARAERNLHELPRPSPRDTADPARRALKLLNSAANEVREMLRGPAASSELRIALKALRQATGELTAALGLPVTELAAHEPTDPLPRSRRGRKSRTTSK